jgi:hypothetical protein
VPKNEQDANDLAKRTLTSFNNQSPARLMQAHQKLDDHAQDEQQRRFGDPRYERLLTEESAMDKEKLFQPAIESAQDNTERLKKAIEKTANSPPPMDTAEKLHAALTRSFAALHAIRRLGQAEQEASYGWRKPCRSAECASCVAYRALIVEGQLPAHS